MPIVDNLPEAPGYVGASPMRPRTARRDSLWPSVVRPPSGFGTLRSLMCAVLPGRRSASIPVGDCRAALPVPEWFGVGSDDVSMGAQLGLGMLRWSSLGGSRFVVFVG